MKKLITGVIIGIIFGVLTFVFLTEMLQGQVKLIVVTSEPELIYKYDNIKNYNLGGGQHKFTMEAALPYKVYQNGDTLINRSEIGEVKWRINGKSDYKINKVGSGSAFEETYDIDSDSFEVEYFIDDDIIMELNDDTTNFIKNGKVIYRNRGMSVFNDGIKLDKTKVKIFKNKLKIKFNRSDKTKKAKIDPTWSWQPSGIPDAYTNSGAPDGVNNNTDLVIGDGAGAMYQFCIMFPGWQDSLTALGAASIVAGSLKVVNSNNSNTPSAFLARIPGEGGGYWSGTTLTYNTLPDSASPYSDTITFTGTGTYRWNITSIIDTIFTNTLIDSGLILLNDSAPLDNYAVFHSSDHEVAAERPMLIIEYVPYGGTLSLTLLDTASVIATIDTGIYSKSDSFRVFNIIGSDSVPLTGHFTGLIDTIDTLSRGNQYIMFARGYHSSPVESIKTNLDTIITYYNVLLTADYRDTITLTFTVDTAGYGVLSSFDSVKIVKASDTTVNYTGFSAVLTDTVDTLTPNTLYDFQALIYNDNALLATSNTDSIYTDPFSADIDSASMLSDSSFYVRIDPKGNPSYTLYSLLDCFRVAAGSTNYFCDPDSRNWLPNRTYKNYDSLGGASGVNIILNPNQLDANDTIRIFVESLSGDSVAWGLQ